jgi:hypothetical protein
MLISSLVPVRTAFQSCQPGFGTPSRKPLTRPFSLFPPAPQSPFLYGLSLGRDAILAGPNQSAWPKDLRAPQWLVQMSHHQEVLIKAAALADKELFPPEANHHNVNLDIVDKFTRVLAYQVGVGRHAWQVVSHDVEMNDSAFTP